MHMNLSTPSCIGALVAVALLAGCATQPTQSVDHEKSFSHALHECRPKRTGRPSQSLQPIPPSGRVAECLKRHGWNTDGTRYESSPTDPSPER